VSSWTPTLHYADLHTGTVHYCSAGRGPAALLIHHTPRSWTYYRALLPLLAVDRTIVAFDSPGFGDSEVDAGTELTIELFADVALTLLDHLGIAQCDVLGAMTGACVAVDLATRASSRVRKLVLVSPPMFLDAEDKARELARVARQRSGAPEPDGSHALRFWDMAIDNWRWDTGVTDLPPDTTAYDLARDFTVDSLRAGANWANAAKAAYSFDLEAKLPQIVASTLVIGPDAPFPYAYLKRSQQVAALVPGSEFVSLRGTPITITTTHAAEMAAILQEFLDREDDV
jgi:pimeloyl-ACP methyl ester carboxylesterase